MRVYEVVFGLMVVAALIMIFRVETQYTLKIHTRRMCVSMETILLFTKPKKKSNNMREHNYQQQIEIALTDIYRMYFEQRRLLENQIHNLTQTIQKKDCKVNEFKFLKGR